MYNFIRCVKHPLLIYVVTDAVEQTIKSYLDYYYFGYDWNLFIF